MSVKCRHWCLVLSATFLLTLAIGGSIRSSYAADPASGANIQAATGPSDKTGPATSAATGQTGAPTNVPAADNDAQGPNWTNPRTLFALLVAGITILVIYVVLCFFAKRLQVRGSNTLLRIISSAQGWASLAQLQIILWTMVIGGGAVFVMVLHGTLITIGTETLSLLGIAGIAAVGSQLRSAQQNQAASAADPASNTSSAAASNAPAPGPISLLTQRAPAAGSELAITWPAPTGGAASCTYAVYYRESAAVPNNNPWFVGATQLTGTDIVLIGLRSETPYDVQVVATNASGSNTPTTARFSTGAAAPAPPAGVPTVTNLAPSANEPAANSFAVDWAGQAGVTFTVQYRAHESADAWRLGATTPQATATISGLKPGTAYDVRVIGANDIGDGPPSAIITCQTAPAPLREPKWTDLVMDTDRAAEIDVTRVQMLFFTVISACYVALHILTDGVIKDVGSTYVELMGLSNGVYLTSKFIGR